jgi:hypothetical protein
MDMLSAATEKPTLQSHSPGSDEQRAGDQQAEPASASPTREDSNIASEGADLNARPSTPPTIQSTPFNRTTLSSTDMEMLVPRLAELERQGAGQHISVPLIDITLGDIQNAVNRNDDNWQYTSIRYEAGRKDEGYTMIYVSENKPAIDWAGFTAGLKRPTNEEARDILEQIPRNPPQGDIAYYVGHMDIASDKSLDPGPSITDNPDLKDLHTPHHHIGGPFSATRTHWEDLTQVEETSTGPVYHGLRSFNEVYYGPGFKIWLLIKKYHIAKFDAFIKANWQCNECDNAASHHCLLFAPSRLDREDIHYDIAVVGRGEALWTLPGQQHAIVNVGYCAARSINFLHPGDRVDFKKVTACSEDGMFAIGKKYGNITAAPLVMTRRNHKRKAQQEHHKAYSKRITRTNTACKRELIEIENKLAAIRYRPIQIDRGNPSNAELNVYKKVAAVRSTVAIEQFIKLLEEWKEERSAIYIDETQDPLNKAVARVKIIAGKAMLSKFRLRLAQTELARESDKAKGPSQINHKEGFLEQLAADHQMGKAELKNHIQEGGQWNTVCASNDGLLPFIFLNANNAFAIKKMEWESLSRRSDEAREEARAFHELLNDDYTRNLCVSGKVFQEMVSGKETEVSVDELLKKFRTCLVSWSCSSN